VNPITSYTTKLNESQAKELEWYLREHQFEPRTIPYARFGGAKPDVNVVFYESGKLVVQGKGTQEFVEFVLEPLILKEAKLGYETQLNPELLAPRIGVDESGKGDFFGPLVIAGAYTDETNTRALMEAGVTDSKRIGSDVRIRELAKIIRATEGVFVSSITLAPEKYNALYKKFGNLNRMLGWGHAKVIENLLDLRPDCPRALSDKFASASLIKRAFSEKGKHIQLDARTKAESDVAVAAASVIARERFINWMGETSRDLGVTLPRGSSDPRVKIIGGELCAKHGPDVLLSVAKVHFKTAHQIAPDSYEYVEKPFFRRPKKDA